MCETGTTAVCTDTVDDPENCGACGIACTATEACLTSQCACRPGLKACGNACDDLLHDPANCGACGHVCGVFQRCTDGVCSQGATGCGANRTFCPSGGTPGGGGCYTQQELESNPIHCSAVPGNCGVACNANQVCAQGTCTDFFVSASCTTSPCPACGTGTTTCPYPGTMEAICVTGNTCPQ
jgi:hypothetical protein